MRKTVCLSLAFLTLGIPRAAAAQSISDLSSEQQQQLINRCKEDWQPFCEQLGVEKPNSEQSQKPPSALQCALQWKKGCPGEREAVQSLISSGPSGMTFPNPFEFFSTGFIRSGWPVVIKYQVRPGAEAVLKVTPQYGGGTPFNVTLPTSVDGSVQLYRLTAGVPGSQENVVVANFAITGRYLSPATGRYVLEPVTILGFGAGPRAVGSVAIDDITYDPPVVKRPSDNSSLDLTYTYLLKNDFDRVAEDLWRNCADIGPFCNFSHPRRPYRPSVRGPQRWDWLVNRKTKLGQYQLVVRAWQTCGALADPNAYHQCGDELAWVIGSAGPVFVQ